MGISFRPIPIANGAEHDALLVLSDHGALVGVIVHLSAHYEDPALEGRWFLEAGFGKYDARGKVFDTLEAVTAWFEGRAKEEI